MAVTTPFQCLTLSLLILPPLFLATYFLAQFPHAPEVSFIHPSLASLPRSSKTWEIYSEDFYDGGAYIKLPFGTVRYWLIGPENGKKVRNHVQRHDLSSTTHYFPVLIPLKIVLIHGLSVPAMIWRDVAPALASNGFRVLLYDLYGRGYSDAPQMTYDAPLYATQLALLMQHIKWEKTLVAGVSMGGGIAAAFNSYFPHLVDGKIALIASAGLIESSDMSRTSKFMSSPLVQTVTSSSPFRFYLQRLANSSYADPIYEVVRLQSAHLPGYNAALASSLRDGPIRGLSSAFKEMGASNHDVLLIWGTADNTVPYKYAARMQSLVPQSELITIQGGGHDLTVSHSETISVALVRFFQQKKK